MNVQDIYSLARNITATDTSSFPDATLLRFLNTEYSSVRSVISSKMPNFVAYQEWYTDLTVGQSIYPLPKRTATKAGCTRVAGVSAKFGDNFEPLQEQVQSGLNEDLNAYAETPIPFYLLRGDSILLYPTPKETVAGGLYLYGEANDIDLTSTSLEEDIKVPLNYHQILVHGIAYWIQQTRRNLNDVQAQLQFKNNAINSMVNEYSPLNKEPVQIREPNLSNLS